MVVTARILLIAVDGPAASGKGTIARALATYFGLPHMDTGLLYRAVALSLFRFGGDVSSEFEAVRACHEIDKIDPSDDELRSEVVGSIASRVSAYAGVRAALLDKQRSFAAQPGGAVLDGRDIGTVVAPDATVKFYVTASAEVRARRRLAELEARGIPTHFDEVLRDIQTRDQRDSGRDAAPLAMADDAILLDTSGLDVDQAINEAIRLVDERIAS
jgi:cytidylate kinase